MPAILKILVLLSERITQFCSAPKKFKSYNHLCPQSRAWDLKAPPRNHVSTQNLFTCILHIYHCGRVFILNVERRKYWAFYCPPVLLPAPEDKSKGITWVLEFGASLGNTTRPILQRKEREGVPGKKKEHQEMTGRSRKKQRWMCGVHLLC